MCVPRHALCLLGTFRLDHDGDRVDLGQPRLEELVALLAICRGEAVPRAQIAYQIWPESNERQARVNLRNLLHKLRQAWPGMDDVIDVTRSHIIWRDDAGLMVDVHHFDSLQADVSRSHDADKRIAALTDAVDFYSGDFMPNCFADWSLAERERLRGEYATALEQLIELLLEQRHDEDALQRAKVLQRFDSLRESTYRQLMRAYAALGDRAAALRIYHTCASTLQDELGVEPSPATEQLRARLLRLQEQHPAPDVPRGVQRQRLVGRHAEWQRLLDAWRDAQMGTACCLLIWGEAGIGKTRLAEELIDWVRRQGHASASSRSYAVEGALTYAPIAEWLRSPAIEPALEKIDDLWRVELSRLLPELLVDRPDLPPPGPMSESWQQQRFYQSIVHALQAAPGPLLLHLDDMQWSDAETLTLLQYLLHGASDHPLLLIGGIRSEEADGHQALASFVEATRRASQLVELRVGLLSAQETVELAAQTSGKDVETGEAEALFAASEGHPLYLIESVRSGLTVSTDRTNAMPSNPSDMHGIAAMPSRIYNLLVSRLEQLSATAQQVASLAAVIGRAFDYEILQRAVSLDEMALIDALDELWRRRIIREQANNGYDFSHDRIREVAYQEISRVRRRLYHRKVAEALEVVYSNELDEIGGEVATHFAQAGDSPRAFQYYRRAAQNALDQYAFSHAEALYQAALDHAPDDPVTRIELLGQLGRIYAPTLRLDQWRDTLKQQQDLLGALEPPDPSLCIAVMLRYSKFLGNSGDTEKGLAIAREATGLAEAINDADILVDCYQELGSTYWLLARMAEASQSFSQMAHLARQVNDHSAEAAALELQAQAGMFSGMPTEEIHAHLTQAFGWAEAHDNKTKMAQLLVKFGYLVMATGVGEFDRGEQYCRSAYELGGKIHDRRQQSNALSNLGVLLANRGNYRRAAEAHQDAATVAQAQGSYWRNGIALHYIGAMHMQMGQFERALREVTEASTEIRRIGSHHFGVKACCDLGFLHHLAGDQQQAESELKQVLAMTTAHGDLRFEALTLTRLGYVMEATNRLPDAYPYYARARKLHHQMGQHYYAMNALAGLARIAASQGDGKAALDHVATIWETIGNQEMDATIETARTLRTCYAIFDAQADPRATYVLAMARQQLQCRVSTIDDPAHIEQFWRIEEHCFFRHIAVED